jgi:ribA/ribD-fused uncharacterized protein
MEFQGEYRFLSNFYPCTIRLDNVDYPSVEHAYQAAKTADKGEREIIRTAATPGKAKEFGRKVTLRPDWTEDIKINTMYMLLMCKFKNSDDLTVQLLETEDRTLIEGNNWGDTYWGMVDGKGENWLGELLMLVRAVLKQHFGI